MPGDMTNYMQCSSGDHQLLKHMPKFQSVININKLKESVSIIWYHVTWLIWKKCKLNFHFLFKKNKQYMKITAQEPFYNFAFFYI
jgi:hypothetical protein